VVSTITLNVPGGIPAHGQFREVRKTSDGTYLVTYLQLNQAMEFDATGKQLRTFPAGASSRSGYPNGNTLIGCGDAHRVIEVDRADKVVWRHRERDRGQQARLAAGVQRLANGNTVISNYPGHFAVESPRAPGVRGHTRQEARMGARNAARWTSNVEVSASRQVGMAALR